MTAHMLEKDVILYKSEFDSFMKQNFPDVSIDRMSMDLSGLKFRAEYMIKHGLDHDKLPALQYQIGQQTNDMQKVFSKFPFEFIATIIGIPAPFKLDNMIDAFVKNANIDPVYFKLTMCIVSDSVEFLQYIDDKIDSEKPFRMYPNQYFRFFTDSYNDGVAKAYPELFENHHIDGVEGADGDIFCHNFTFQVTEDCSLNCYAGNTMILMADWTEKPIKDIKVGDMVLGIPEHQPNNDHEYYDYRYYIPTRVTRVYHREADCIKVTWANGIGPDDPIYMTPDHPILLSDESYVPFIDWYHEKHDANAPIFVGEDKYLSNFNQWELDVDETPVRKEVYNLETECHTFIAWNMVVHNCTYCYQCNKTPAYMDFNTAKLFVDKLLNDEYGYINRHNSPAIIIEFIGGEPLLAITLIRKIYEYFLEQTYRMNHPWFTLHRLSICSNGLQYFDDEVQSFFKDYHENISFNISIDGNKELHDACRIQPNGEGSYDIAMMALDHFTKHYTPERNSKMTLAPLNMTYLFDSVVDFINRGMMIINLNCVFEEGWNQQTAKEEYHQLKRLADYLIENRLDNLYIAIFNERQEDVQGKEHDGNFCLKEGTQVLTRNGSMAIESIRPGDQIYTASGNIQYVEKMSKYKSNDNMVFRASGAFPMHCTSDHKFFAKKFLYMGWKGVIHYSEPGFYPVSELKKGDRIALPILKLIDNGHEYIPYELAYALGVYIADGYIDTRNNVIVITPGYDEDEYYRSKLETAGLSFSTFLGDTSIRYSISAGKSSKNSRFFNLCMCCGSHAADKHMPVQVFKSDKSTVEEVIRGYMDTDGHQYEDGRIAANTVSPALANDLLILLRAIGEFPTCYFCKRAGKSTICGREVTIRDRYEIYYNPKKRNTHNMFAVDDEFGVMWSGIHAIEKDPESYMVYCPTVDVEHTFIGGGFASRNCGGTGSLLAMRPNGQFYPCIRYMPTSVGDNVPDLCIGDIHTGMIGRSDGSEILQMMDRITRRSQSNDICYDCPIGNDCAWCSALGHAVYGTPNKRPMFVCIQMIAEALANVYYWNRLILAHPEYDLDVRKNNVPDEWALLVINQDELEELKLLESAAIITVMEHRGKPT